MTHRIRIDRLRRLHGLSEARAALLAFLLFGEIQHD